ncbi:MAG: hypothetical protein EBS34_10125 [Flavobacteriales bacterium]|nr:hypothetical protein [Flavobacteriales bacterium]
MQATAKGFFIHRRAYSTKANILTFFTFEHGTFDFLYFASRKSPALIPFSQYEIEYNEKANFRSVVRFSLVHPANNWHANPNKLAIAYFIADVVNQTTQINNQDSSAYHALLLVEALLTKEMDAFYIPFEFLNLWMEVLGILPEAVKQANSFDISEGLFLTETQTVDIAAITWNEILQKKPVEDKIALKHCFSLMINYMAIHVPNFNVTATLTILKQIFS